MVDELKYLKQIKRSQHSFDLLTSEVDLEAQIEKGASREIVRELGNYISEVLNVSELNHRHRAAAQYVLGLNSKADLGVDSSFPKPVLNQKKKQLISDAVSKGYVSFSLNLPWHASLALDRSQPDTYPFQHSSMLLYTGQDKHMFLKEEEKQFLHEKYDEPRNPESILKQGYLRRGVSHNDRVPAVSENAADTRNVSPDTPEERGTRIPGIYCSATPQVPRGYAESSEDSLLGTGVVLELQIPSKWITAFFRGPGEGDAGPKLHNLEQMKNKIEHPSRIRELLQNDALPFEFIERSAPLPLEYITGVWDPERTPKPAFVPMEEFVPLIRSDIDKKLPDKSQMHGAIRDLDDTKVELETEIETLKKIEKISNPGSNSPTQYEDAEGGLNPFSHKLSSRMEKMAEYAITYDKAEEALSCASSINQHLSEYDELIETLVEISYGVLDEQPDVKNVKYHREIERFLQNFEPNAIPPDSAFEKNRDTLQQIFEITAKELQSFYSGEIESAKEAKDIETQVQKKS
nr:MAG: hypothetical protein J07AB56_09620 [Candidatus Nanosalinarum sp. J07AB56]